MLFRTGLESDMGFLPQEPYRRTVYMIFYIVLGIFAVYVAAKYVFPIILPFVLAFAAASLLRRPAAVMSRKTKIPQRAVSVVLVILFLTAAIGLLFAAVTEMADQLIALAGSIASGESVIVLNFTAMLDKLETLIAGLPFFSGEDADAMRETVGTALTDMFKNAVSAFASKIPGMIARLASAIPQALIFSAVTVLSAVYFCADYEKIVSYIKTHLHGKPRAALREIYGQTGHTLMKYLKSYLILFFFTFAQLFVGFLILRQKYAFVLAIVVALVDILPVLGTGTVLLPWAAYLFFTGDIRMAVGLLILYAVISILRQILEPKIVGAGIGLHPLLALASMYVGLRVFGFFGMLLLPLAVVIIKNTVTAFRSAHPKEERS